MATTYTYKNGTGNVATTFPFTFPYIKDSDVKVEVKESGAWVTKTKDTHYEFTNATTLKFLSGQVPVSGTNNIKISRATDADKLTATFYPGSAIRSVDLNDNFTQNLYSTEESKETGSDAQLATDRLVAVTYDGGTTWTQTGNNTNASTDPKGVGYSITQAEAAVSTANTATTTANSAVTTANSAVTTANSATTTANSAVTTANAATATANTASTNATNAVNTANSASTTAAAAFQRDGSATMTGNIVFEGATDDGNETTLTVTDPTADRTITLPNITGTVVTTGDTGTVTSTMITDGTIATADIADSAVTTAKIANSAITNDKIANGTIHGQNKISNGTVTSDNLADVIITEAKIVDQAVTTVKIANDAVNATKIADDVVNSEHYAAASIDTEHIADANITTVKIADANVTTGKLADNAVTFAKLGCEETTLTANSNTTIPTSKAVNDHVVSLIQDVGGFYPIDDDQKFPNTNPDPNDDAGTIVSIADAGGLVVNGSGVSTTGRTLGGSTVTINGIDSTLYNTTIAAGKGMLVQTTSTLNTYTYHRLVLDEAGVASADTLITDFNQRYRVHAGEPSSHLTDGDLVFDTNANKMKVYDSSASAWKEVTSAGDYKLLTILDTDGSAFDGANQSFNLKDGGSAASVQSAGQLLISVNGVIQKPNSGTSAPTEGFALVDGDTIIFSNAPGAGASVFVTQIGSATTINTPADNSVTTTKIASAAVTTAKIADDAVTSSKLDTGLEINANTIQLPEISGSYPLGYLEFGAPGGSSDNGMRMGFSNTTSNGLIQHLDASGDLIISSAKDVIIENAAGNEVFAKFKNNGACELYHNNVKRLSTTNVAVDVTGILTVSEGANFGATSALQITIPSDGGSGYNTIFTNNSSGDFYLRGEELYIQDSGNSNAAWLKCVDGAGVELSHAGTKKFETISTGATVTGKLGIGTATPQEALHVHSTTVGGAALELSENAGSHFQGLLQMRGNDMEIRGSSGQMEFYTGNADGASSTKRMRISDAGLLELYMGGAGYSTLLKNGANEDNYITQGASGFTVFRDHDGTEHARITADGKIGIGVASPAATVDVRKSGRHGIGLGSTSGAGCYFWLDGASNGDGSGSDYSSLEHNSDGDLVFSVGSPSNTVGERMRITDDGKVGIGTTAPASMFHVNGDTSYTSGRMYVGGAPSNLDAGENNSYAFTRIKGNTYSATSDGRLALSTGYKAYQLGAGDGIGAIYFADDTGGDWAAIRCFADDQGGGSAGSPNDADDYPGRLSFETTKNGTGSPTERHRIDSNGISSFFMDSGANGVRVHNGSSAGTDQYLYLGYHSATNVINGTGVFGVYTNGNAQNANNSWGSWSDVKLKENIVDVSSQWNDIKNLKVRNYNLKEGDKKKQIGLIAQEVETVSPGLVYETKDKDEDNKDLGTVTKSVMYSVVYMKAIKALQEAMTKIETLETKVAALEAK